MLRDDATAFGARQYWDVLQLLTRAGLQADFVVDDDGGAAVQIQLDSGQTLLVTEVDGPLPRLREDHRSWGVSLHRTRRGPDEEGPAAWDGSQDDGSLKALLPLVSGVLLDTMRGPSSEL